MSSPPRPVWPGGACWVADAFVDDAALQWAGLVLLVVALGSAGAALVNRSAAWLRAIAMLGLLALAWSVLEIARDAADDRTVHGLAGAGAVLASVAAFLTRTPRQHSGNH